MYHRSGNRKTFGQEVQQCVIGRSIYRGCCQSNSHPVALDTHDLSA